MPKNEESYFIERITLDAKQRLSIPSKSHLHKSLVPILITLGKYQAIFNKGSPPIFSGAMIIERSVDKTNRILLGTNFGTLIDIDGDTRDWEEIIFVERKNHCILYFGTPGEQKWKEDRDRGYQEAIKRLEG